MPDQDQVTPRKEWSEGLDDGPYVLKSLLEDVPLSAADGDGQSIVINCIEFWGMFNTSAEFIFLCLSHTIYSVAL